MTPEQKALADLLAYVASCKMRNTKEWMIGLTEKMNAALEVLGDDDRFEFPGGWTWEMRIVKGDQP